MKGDRKSIGDNRKDLLYTTTTLNLTEIKSFYLFTDGFIDQNDSENVKFGTRRFRELLVELQGNSEVEQFSRLENEINNHRGKESQRDDVTVVGIINN